ncbi:FadR family transcriptional regulator [Natronospirillum operosum]|uniref:FadR family transcriptional regulator n=1 Tax=Natronospirillum operosum TaxID=2759953 RepID=A0A4Z0WE85_9GAMM|nr:FadR/GntR family transcriptional regulator [Natronospirillum operosum]TGG93476.1 FadR family transcriptional regulator [Natronospirillum operosum]
MARVSSQRPQNIHTWVARELGSRIVSGTYRAGDYIPNEGNLVDELGVSRTALREAFKLLTAKGLIESRPKLGTRVRAHKHWNMFDTDVLRWYFDNNPKPEFYKDLYEMRAIIEPSAAALAASNRTEEQLAALEQACVEMEHAQIGTEAVYQSDLAFHLGLLTATNNVFMASLGMTIETALESTFRLSSAISEEFEASLPGHRAVLEAVRAQQPDQARAVMQDILTHSRAAMERSLKTFKGFQT